MTGQTFDDIHAPTSIATLHILFHVHLRMNDVDCSWTYKSIDDFLQTSGEGDLENIRVAMEKARDATRIALTASP